VNASVLAENFTGLSKTICGRSATEHEMARLAQTSIRFRRFEISERRFQELIPAIDQAAEDTAQRIYGELVTVDVYIEAGSFLVRITLIGGLLLGSYHAVSDSNDFKKEIVELVKHAEDFGSAIYEEVLRITGETQADVIRRRSMTPGKISQAMQRIDRLRELKHHGSQDLERISAELNRDSPAGLDS
jgi:hypothetical protein